MSAGHDLHDVAVLVVDDVEDNLDLIADWLEDEVWSVLRARSGNEAVRLAIEYEPDVVLLDLMMPSMSGFAVLREIRSVEALRNIGIILQTAYTGERNIATACRMGCHHILCKPLSKARLLAEMSRCLQERPRCPTRDQDQRNEQPERIERNDVLVALGDTRRILEAERLIGLVSDAETFDCLHHLLTDESQISQRLIKLANSPSYAGRQRSRTVSQAIVRIGTRNAAELIRKASSPMRGGFSASLAIKALEILDRLAQSFPDHTATTGETLALVHELKGGSHAEGHETPQDLLVDAQDNEQETCDHREPTQ